METLEGSRRRKMFPVHFSCVSSVDTPADSIKATFLISHPKEWMKEIKTLELQEDGDRLFHGICDRQIVSLQQDGCRMTVWGRSDAALLLDNEAIPQEYVRVSLDEMFDKHIKPYGFQNELGLTGSLSNYRVGKGISEWETFLPSARERLEEHLISTLEGFLFSAGKRKSYHIRKNTSDFCAVDQPPK